MKNILLILFVYELYPALWGLHEAIISIPMNQHDGMDSFFTKQPDPSNWPSFPLSC